MEFYRFTRIADVNMMRFIASKRWEEQQQQQEEEEVINST